MPYQPEQTPEQYYADEDNLGSGQFVTLKEVIDETLLDGLDDDSYLKNTNRSLILSKAFQGIRKLTWDCAKRVYMVGFTVGEDLYFPLPQTYVDWVRISVIIDGQLMPLNVNNKINTSVEYLQDNDAFIIFDEDGQIITADAYNATAKPYKKIEFCADAMGGQFETDVSILSKYGEVKLDEIGGMMFFSSNLANQNIVLEFFSDGLEMQNIPEQQIKIHKFLQEALGDWIYYACIAKKRNISRNEKDSALRRFKTTAHKAKIKRSNFDLNEISRLVSIGSKML